MSLDDFALLGATIVAATLGFGAVLLQIRSSEAQLRRQIADRDERSRKERTRRIASVAKALLVEIQDFQRSYLLGMEKGVESTTALAKLTPYNLPRLGSYPAGGFEIYTGNVGVLGEFDEQAVELIVRFYKTAAEHFAAYRDYQGAFERLNSNKQDGEAYDDAKFFIAGVIGSIPVLRKQAEDASRELVRVGNSLQLISPA